MWQQTLQSKGMSESDLPKSIKSMIEEYKEIVEGIAELQQEISQETDMDERAEMQSDLDELHQGLQEINQEIEEALGQLQAGGGSSGDPEVDNLKSAWDNRRQEWLSGDKKNKTKSLFNN